MIGPDHWLPLVRRARLLELSRSSVYYLPRPTSSEDLALMRSIDELHVEHPFAGSRMMRDSLKGEGYFIGRKHVATLMRTMGNEALYQKPNTSGRHAAHPIYPHLLRNVPIERLNRVWAMDAFDRWMVRHFPKLPFCRYADDGLIHCRSRQQARYVQERLAQRLQECGLELHPDKTKVVYCRDVHRRQEHECIQFDFLGYTFRPRRSQDRHGRLFTNFTPAIAPAAAQALRQEVRRWPLQLKSDKSIEDLSRMFNPVISGWVHYYCRFHPSAFYRVAAHINRALVRWATRKFKTLRGHQRRARAWVTRVARQRPRLFAHWRLNSAVAAR